MAEPSRPFTPETLAERWLCSAETVRQLVWREIGAAPITYAANTPFGLYIFYDYGGEWRIFLDASGAFLRGEEGEPLCYPTPEAAKAAAQADYEARIMAALTPAPADAAKPTATVTDEGGIRVMRGDAASVAEAATILRDKLLVLVPLSPAPADEVRRKALMEAEKAMRDWKDDLNANRMHETADTVGMAAAVVLALIEKDTK